MTKQSLTRLYHELNQQFFNGRLPRYRVTYYKPLMGQGSCLLERHLIRLSPTVRGDQVRCVLLHEMCHIGTPDHGKKFQAKLTKLAKMGEAWAAQEVAMSAQRQPNWQFQVKWAIKDALIDQPGAHFWPLIRWVAADIGMTAGQLLRRCPWVRATFKKARAEAREFHQYDERIEQWTQHHRMATSAR